MRLPIRLLLSALGSIPPVLAALRAGRRAFATSWLWIGGGGVGLIA